MMLMSLFAFDNVFKRWFIFDPIVGVRNRSRLFVFSAAPISSRFILSCFPLSIPKCDDSITNSYRVELHTQKKTSFTRISMEIPKHRWDDNKHKISLKSLWRVWMKSVTEWSEPWKYSNCVRNTPWNSSLIHVWHSMVKSFNIFDIRVVVTSNPNVSERVIRRWG